MFVRLAKIDPILFFVADGVAKFHESIFNEFHSIWLVKIYLFPSITVLSYAPNSFQLLQNLSLRIQN